MTTDLTTFLRARLDHDEKVATSAYTLRMGVDYICHVCGRPSSGTHHSSGRADIAYDCGHTITPEEFRDWYTDPAPPKPRDMAEIRFKRAILARHTPDEDHADVDSVLYGTPPRLPCRGCGTNKFGEWISPTTDNCPELRDLATVYEQHPEYKDEWRP